MDEDKWGFYGDKPPCEHLLALRAFLESMDMWVKGELTDTGWVNVHCRECARTYEVEMMPPWRAAP
jgi:hypothetical protein